MIFMTRTSAESKEHIQLIEMMANHFKSLGCTDIKADLDGYSRPDSINGYIPDLTCYKNGVNRSLIILEAETCSSIFDQHTERQWTAFYNRSRTTGSEFHIVVPKTCNTSSSRESVKERLRQLGISANEIWTPRG